MDVISFYGCSTLKRLLSPHLQTRQGKMLISYAISYSIFLIFFEDIFARIINPNQGIRSFGNKCLNAIFYLIGFVLTKLSFYLLGALNIDRKLRKPERLLKRCLLKGLRKFLVVAIHVLEWMLSEK